MQKEGGAAIIASHASCFTGARTSLRCPRERQRRADCRSGKTQLLFTPRLCLNSTPHPRCPCRKGTRHFSGPVSREQPHSPQLLSLEPLIWENGICFPFGPYERGQKQKAILVSGQEVFAQPSLQTDALMCPGRSEGRLQQGRDPRPGF